MFLIYFSEKSVSDTGGDKHQKDKAPNIPKSGHEVRKNMERGLHERDRVGVQDFVLLEDFESEVAFIDNLQKRFNENLIYVSKRYFLSNSCFVFKKIWKHGSAFLLSTINVHL